MSFYFNPLGSSVQRPAWHPLETSRPSFVHQIVLVSEPDPEALFPEPFRIAKLLHELGFTQVPPVTGLRWLVVAAHPDDETLGASWILRRASDLDVLHVTDGAPLDRVFWSPRAPKTRWEYAQQRADEARGALAVAGISESRIHCLGLTDQSASHGMGDLALKLEQIILEWSPDLLLVQPYEGGHPDHDACAFAVHAAVRRLERANGRAPVILEMTSYHRWKGALRTGEFLPASGRQVRRDLGGKERELKAQMLACFASQTEVLLPFRVDKECFRLAPTYDFRVPPHAGLLHYESLGWPMRSAIWCELAAAAMHALGLEEPASVLTCPEDNPCSPS